MDTAGIICEFNPFHKGHRYLIEKVRQAGAKRIVCVMSGCFVQRGQPAVFDKFERARSAIEGGADLVLELPALYAVNSADYFSRGGIRILRKLGCIDTIAFGSECGDAQSLEAAAHLEDDAEFSEVLRHFISEGLSYPKAYSKAALLRFSELDPALFREPNNTLGICYLKENIRQNAGLDVFTVKRSFPYCGTEIRGGMEADPAVVDRQRILFALIRQKIAGSPKSAAAEICEVSEGLENRMSGCLAGARDLDDLIKSVKSSRYTYAKISRILIQLLLGITKEAVEAAEEKQTAYARVLALNEKGASVLKDAGRKGQISIISNVNKAVINDDERQVLNVDIYSSDLYSILCGRVINEYSDRVRIPEVIKI